MQWRKWNNILHRDLGYLAVGLKIIYCVSGIALNHKHDWNPNYVKKIEQVNIGQVKEPSPVSEITVVDVLDKMGLPREFRSFFQPDPDTLQIFTDHGNIQIDLNAGQAEIERVKKRTVLIELNFLHLNNPRRLWTYFSDLYAVVLIFLAISGVFVLKGKKGLRGRGKWLTLAGIVSRSSLSSFIFKGNMRAWLSKI